MKKIGVASTDRAAKLRVARQGVIDAAMELWGSPGYKPNLPVKEMSTYDRIRLACWKLHRISRGR